eukprot:scaffold1513_cov100-Amphora_coffeaeformis.AAC.14
MAAVLPILMKDGLAAAWILPNNNNNNKKASSGNKPLQDDIPDLIKLPAQLANHHHHPSTNRLQYTLAVGSKEAPFPLQGLRVELTATRQTPKAYSTGIHVAKLLRAPTYIDKTGQKTVDLQQGGGGWEIVWRKNNNNNNNKTRGPHGYLACSFVATQRHERNEEGACLEAGRFWIYHRVWTPAMLQSERVRRREIQARAAACLQERDEKLQTLVDDDDAGDDPNSNNNKAKKNVGEKV